MNNKKLKSQKKQKIHNKSKTNTKHRSGFINKTAFLLREKIKNKNTTNINLYKKIVKGNNNVIE